MGYLQKLFDEHGNDWPAAVLEKLLYFHSASVWPYPDLADGVRRAQVQVLL